MKTETLSINEAAVLGYTHRVQVTYADLTSSGATQTIALLTVAPGDIVRHAAFKLVTPFVNSGLSSLVPEVGDGGDVDRFIDNAAGGGTEVLGTATEIDVYAAPNATGTYPYAYVAADTVDVTFTGNTTGLSSSTAGEIHFFLNVSSLNPASARIT